MRARTLSRCIAAAAAATLLAACAPEPEPAPQPEPSVTATPAPTPEPILAPLTGVAVDAAIETPALAAKIDNHPEARPQIGLEATDILIEELVEGGMTRYVAVWQSTVPDEIGPVRSIRPMDPAIITPFGGLVAYSGGQERFVAAMQSTGLTNVIHGGEYDGYFFRTGDRIAPHNVILQAARLVDEVDADAPAPQFSYVSADGEPSSEGTGEPASRLDLAFSPSESREWDCEAASARWQRSQNGVADTAADGTRLSAANVVVLRVGVGDNGGVPETLLVGQRGEGFVASGCSWVPVTWSKGEAGDSIEVLGPDDEPVLLAPGNTWVELVPTTGSAAAS